MQQKITASARLLQPTALLLTGWCHINSPREKSALPGDAASCQNSLTTCSNKMSTNCWFLVVHCFGVRKLHGSLGEQDNVLHRQRVWSCNLDSAGVFCRSPASSAVEFVLSCLQRFCHISVNRQHIASPLFIALLLDWCYSHLQFCFCVVAEDLIHVSDKGGMTMWKVLKEFLKLPVIYIQLVV